MEGEMDEEKALMEKDEEKMDEKSDADDKNKTCCCSDTLCIGIAWGVFIILVVIFILAMVLKYQKDG
jgi:hypothetical protein|tara:strand:+ start:584 stop:784 length:201 start_codon:yes stop_codon:yes gene_type:complete